MATLMLTPDVREELEVIASSRTVAKQRVERAQVLLAVAAGEPVAEIARRLRTSRPRVYRTVAKAKEVGALAALNDLVGGRGRPERITDEARVWVLDLACQKPTSLGYPHELWTRQLLAQHIRKHCAAAGYPALAKVSAGTVTKILLKHRLKPHKVRYFVENRDPDFERKKIEVLHFYRDVQLVRDKAGSGDGQDTLPIAYLSYDEKPGIQALSVTAAELPPTPDKHPSMSRDYEYVRHGTLTLMAGIDLLSGEIIPHVVPRHRSCEFIEWLKLVDERYPAGTRILVLLDNHSAHTSKETRQFLSTMPGRFEFTFTPKHGSWLNLIENFFSKLARSILREIRVKNRDELRDRLLDAIRWLNQEPVVFRWTWGLDDISPSACDGITEPII